MHEDQTRITDTEVNRQPYLVDFGDDGLGTQWVSVAEPYGRAFAASAIFLTDATTGRTRIWRVPERTSLSGNRRAIQAVKAVSIPGIDFGDETPGSGNFRVVEPRPVFVDGRLVYLTSIIPNSANAVSKTVIVDAETNKLVAIFDNDRDPQAEEKTLRYIETGEVPDEAVAPGAAADAGHDPDARRHGTTTPSGTSTTPSAERRAPDRRHPAPPGAAARGAPGAARRGSQGGWLASVEGAGGRAERRVPARGARRGARRRAVGLPRRHDADAVGRVREPRLAAGELRRQRRAAADGHAALVRELEEQRARHAWQRALVGRRAERAVRPTTGGC